MSGTVNGRGKKFSIIEMEAYKRSEREGLKYRGLRLAFRAHIRYFLLRDSNLVFDSNDPIQCLHPKSRSVRPPFFFSAAMHQFRPFFSPEATGFSVGLGRCIGRTPVIYINSILASLNARRIFRKGSRLGTEVFSSHIEFQPIDTMDIAKAAFSVRQLLAIHMISSFNRKNKILYRYSETTFL